MVDDIDSDWSTLKEEVRYENPWIKVEHHEVVRPNGSDGIYGVVRFKHCAVGILAIDEGRCVWLVRQTRYPLNSLSLEIPEGGACVGEVPMEAARRELQEETGLTASRWRQILKLHLSNSVTDEKAYIFLATELTIGLADLEDSEDITIHKVPLDEVVEMVYDGKITDAITVAAVMYLQANLSCLEQSP